MKIPKIVSVIPIDDHTLIVVFNNNDKKKYDVLPLLSKNIFEPLRNPVFFKSFNIEKGGHAITWNKDIDLSEYELWHHGQTMP
ncbi:hypothetical protein TI05_08280 [Achromatium sp. WMS3]|nr:hypothetical protein TI05_08280 [Achromatium sp. WMS3]